MTQSIPFPSPEAIRVWANTTVSKNMDGMICVQHYKDHLYYYFALEAGMYVYKMNSISPLGE